MADFSYPPDFSSDRRPSWDFSSRIPPIYEVSSPRFSLNPTLESVDPLVLQAVELASTMPNTTIGEMLDHLIAAEARPAHARRLRDDLSQLVEELEAAKHEISDLKRQLGRTTAQRDSWEKSARATRDEADELNQQLAKGHEEYLKLRRQIDDAVDILAMTPQRGKTPPRSRAEQIVIQQLFEED